MAAGARVYCTRERVTINARQEKSRVKSHRAYHLSPASLSGNKKENSDRLLWKGNFLPVQWESELFETRMWYCASIALLARKICCCCEEDLRSVKKKKKKKQEAYNVNKWILQKYVKHGEYSARYNKIGKDIFPALGFIFFNYIHSRKHEFAQVSAVYLWEK